MKTILIADDRPEIRELVKITLHSNEYRVVEALNGDEAVTIARSEKPDLILMDMMMPVMDGLEATKIIKSSRETSGCLVVMLTAKGQKTDIDAGVEAGTDGYITKPFSPVFLLDTVKSLLAEN